MTPPLPLIGQARSLSESSHVARLRHLWRRSGEVRRSAPHSSRLIERWYAESYAPFLSRGNNAAGVLAISGGLALILGYHAIQLQPARHDVTVWPPSHNAYKYLEARDSLFELAERQVHIVWGVAGVDRAGVNRCNEFDLGAVIWDDDFDASDPDAQVALLRGCTEPALNPALHVVNGSAT